MSRHLLSAVLVVLLASALAGQQTPPAGPTDTQTPPTFKVQVEYVEADVQVTDQKGSFVRDLKKEDFDLFEDGKRQTVSAFSLVDVPIEPVDDPIVTPRQSRSSAWDLQRQNDAANQSNKEACSRADRETGLVGALPSSRDVATMKLGRRGWPGVVACLA
jgi:hypothetical protein